jgi:energy-coupling factor transport system ATP-binding protein
VLELMSRLNREGMTILSITHFMEDAVHARRLIVMEKGRIVLDGTPELVFSDAQRLESLGLELPRATRLAQRLRKYFPALPDPTYRLKNLLEQLPLYPGTALYPGTRLVDSAQQPSEPVNLDPDACIKVSHLGYTYMADTPMAYPAIRDVSMEVSTGEVHGIIGPTGSGKSTLLQHLNGLLRAQEGQIKVGPFDLNDPKVSVKDVCQVVGLVFQDPDMQIFEQFVGDEIAYGPRFFISDKAELRERVRWAMEQVGLDFDRFKDRRTGSLSGGERRKVALASILALKPDVLVLDEPTAGLDPVSRRELRSRLLSLKLAGTTLVISSHQMEDLALLADRMTVIYAGQDTYQGATRDVFAREDELTGLGLGVPAASTVAHRLIANGWPISSQICRVEELLAAIEQVYQGLPG